MSIESNVVGGPLDGAYFPPPASPGIHWTMLTQYSETTQAEHVVYWWAENRERWLEEPDLTEATKGKP